MDLCLKAADMEIHVGGFVRVMHPGHGMGIEFPSRTEEQRQRVEDFIGCLSSHPGTSPQLQVSPTSLVSSEMDLNQAVGTNDEEDPLLMLLRTGDDIGQEQFLAELIRQRTPAEA